MTTGMLLNAFISIVLFLAGVTLTFVLIVLKGIQADIISIRKRLHLVEGSQASMLSHIEFMNKGLDTLREMHERVTKIEAVCQVQHAPSNRRR